MKKILLVLICQLLLLTGCGDRTTKIDNCIPQVSYVSTENNVWEVYKVLDKSKKRGFDPLNFFDKDEWYLNLVGKNGQNINSFSFGGLEIKTLQKGSVLSLTGKAIKKSPYGFMTAFHREMIYLHGHIGNESVWVPAIFLSMLAEDENENNNESNKKIGLNKNDFDWSCNQK